jgi:phage terminase large subunit-like protein
MKLDDVTKAAIRSPADEDAVEKGYRYEPHYGEHVCRFFRHLKHTKGQWAGQTFELLEWQRDDVVMPLFSWVNEQGHRRYRMAYIEVPKKNGKSTLCAGLALYLLAGDNEAGAEVYIAACDRNQAGIVYREASAMAKGSELLSDYITPSDSVKNLSLPSTNSFLRVISRESTTAEGLNIHGLIFDELHGQKSRDLWDTLRYGGASRLNPMLISITTAGYDRLSICYEQRTYAEKVRDGIINDESFFPYIRCACEEDDWQDEQIWKKANPSFAVTFTERDFRQAFREAVESPVKENAFKRYRLNIWTEQANRWIQMHRWDDCAEVVHADSRRGQDCYAGLDLSSTQDTSALVLFFPDDNSVVPFFWIPKDNARRREKNDRVPYITWSNQGLLELTPGDAIDYSFIRRRINELSKDFKIREIAYDPWNATQLALQLKEEDGFHMIEFRQGTISMNEPAKCLESMIIKSELKHGGNPILRWMASNVAVRPDASGNIRFDKEHSMEKIDGIVALTMAIGRAIVQTKHESIYETQGLRTV